MGDLFTYGKSLYDFPLRMVWRRLSPDELDDSFRDELPPRMDRMQMLVTVPKKKRRHAVDRVLMRRRIREAYRLNRISLLDVIEENDAIGAVNVAFIYLSDENLPYAVVEEKMKALLGRLERKIVRRENAAKPQSDKPAE